MRLGWHVELLDLWKVRVHGHIWNQPRWLDLPVLYWVLGLLSALLEALQFGHQEVSNLKLLLGHLQTLHLSLHYTLGLLDKAANALEVLS